MNSTITGIGILVTLPVIVRGTSTDAGWTRESNFSEPEASPTVNWHASRSTYAANGPAVNEKHIGFNADVEWAYENGTLFILQARKIRGLED